MTALFQLLGKETQSDQPSPATQGKNNTFDPFELQMQTGLDKPKCKEIRDYITVIQERRDSSPTLKLGDMEFCLSNAKPKLDNVTPLQYMEASLRIVRESALREGADLNQVLQQLSYIIKMAIFGQRFQWKSALKYDSEFRKLQASLQFPWNADSSYLMQAFLQPSVGHSPQTHQPKPSHFTARQSNRYDPNSGKVICEKFNDRLGCNLHNCSYAHVCRSCYNPSHNDFSHKRFTTPLKQSEPRKDF